MNAQTFYFGRLAYDLSWFLIMQTLMMNVIFGILIDAFGGKSPFLGSHRLSSRAERKALRVA
jgi:hypothetical protein